MIPCALALAVVLSCPADVRPTGLPPPRWENIEGSPYWIDGAAPLFTLRGFRVLHEVTLDPGAVTRFHLPAGSWLMLRPTEDGLLIDDLEAWVSSGSRLALRVNLDRDETDALFVAPPGSHPYVVELRRPPDRSGRVRFAAFFSRPIPESPRVRFRDTLDLPDELATVEVPGRDGHTLTRFALIEPRQPCRISVPPRRLLQIETRLIGLPNDRGRDQAYTLEVICGGPPVIIPFVTRIDPTVAPHRERLPDGRLLAPRTFEFEVPAGTTDLELVADARIALRIRVEDIDRWLDDGAAENDTSGRLSPGDDTADSTRPLRRRIVSRSLTLPEWIPELTAPHRVAGDVRAGLALAMALDTLLRDPHLEADERAYARSLAGRWARFAELHSITKPDSASPAVHSFDYKRLVNPTDLLRTRRLHLDDAGIDTAVRGLPWGTFVRVPAGETLALVYPVSGDEGASLLRLAVLDGDGVRPSMIRLAVDDAQPYSLRLTAPVDERRRAPGIGRAALSALLQRDGSDSTALFAGEAARVLDRAPFAEVSAVDIPLPAGTRSVRVWCDDATGPRAALHRLRSREIRATERESALHRDRIPVAQRTIGFWSAVQDARRSPSSDTGVAAGIGARWRHWLPIIERLERWRRSTTAGIDALPPAEAQRIDEFESYLTRTRASALEGEGQWVAALELWSRATGAPRLLERRDAELRRVAVLQELGEHGTAERLMLGIFLHHPDDALRGAMLEMLNDVPRNPRHPGRVGLAATAALVRGEPRYFTELVRALVADGHDRDALEIGLSLPIRDQPLDALALGALHEGWWTTLSSLVARMPSKQAAFWEAYRSAKNGDFDGAEVAFTRAGTRGAAALDRLRRGREIRARVQADDLVTRARAILDWEQWLRASSGARAWELERAGITDHDGSVECVLEPGAPPALYHRASRVRPLRAEILGPAELLVEVRPLHPRSAGTTQSGWIELRIDGRLRPVPVTANRPRMSASIAGLDVIPGQRVVARVDLGPGLHTLELSPDGFDVLVRLQRARPSLSTEVLPALTSARLRAVLAGHEHYPRLPTRVVHHRGDDTQHPTTLHAFPRRRFDSESILGAVRDVDPILAERLALRLHGNPPTAEAASVLEIIARTAKGIDPDERALALQRVGAAERLWQSPRLVPDMPEEMRDEVRLATGDVRGVLDRVGARLRDGIDDPILRTGALAMAIFIAEHEPGLRATALTMAVEHLDRYARDRGLVPLRSRVPSRWSQIRGTSRGGRSRSVSLEESQAEAPWWRTRRALLPPLEPGERLLRGGHRVGLTFDRETASIVRIDLTAVAPLYSVPVDSTVILEVDEESPVAIEVRARAPRRSEVIALEPDRHWLRCWIVDPVADRYVRVTLGDAVSVQHSSLPKFPTEREASSMPVERPTRRYQIATATDPLRVQVEGPAIVRIDRWDGDRATVETRVIDQAGIHELELSPPPGEDEALYRVFRRKFDAATPSRPRRTPPFEPRALPPLPEIDRDAFTTSRPSVDLFSLGGQEDGTWSVTSTYRRRRLFEEGSAGDTLQDEYSELEVTHRYHSEYHSSWFETGGLVRTRERGGPTVGVFHRLRAAPARWPVSLRLSTEGYLQWPEGDGAATTGSTEYALSGVARVERTVSLTERWTLTPTVGIFGRELGLGDDGKFRPGGVDPDIYTDYRSDHRYGGLLEPRITWQPALDTRFFSRGSLVTNERFDADQVRASAGVAQFYRGASLRAEYQYTRFIDDSDRDRARNQQRIDVEVRYDLWTAPDDRLETKCVVRQNLTDGEIGFFVSFAWHYGNRRGYRDFAPDRVPFRSLREERIPRPDREWRP